MSGMNRRLFVLCLVMLMTIAIGTVAYANSAEPPSILIMVPGAPRDLKITIGSGGDFSEAGVKNKVFENYYTFYSRDLKTIDNYTLKVTTNGSSFEIPFNKPLNSYNNMYTLDLKNQKLIPGKSLSRSIMYVALRVILTLLIEGLVFFAFGYRRKSSWIAFLIINLLTQGFLNIWLNKFPPLDSYLILLLIFGEILVFIFEIIGFLIFVKEHRALRTILYVLTANFVSLIAGGFLITILPI